MPNHIHMILVIRNDNILNRTLNRTAARAVPTISDIVGSLKSKISVEYISHIKNNILDISGDIWHRSFYDHIIRIDESLNNIRKYIKNNPATWDND